ncbi:hypothetical protein ACOMICROBIO_LMKGKHOH_04023 [Vibrio sp. B1FIG11]|uniref:cyanobactin maturation protease PatG family protein n=1 Tax=Vibrio sp. B1FIG11 TaxID=2751177 RepID=UPI001AF76787|nr:hypothetical protein [Vibrio sp. B1FIG11]CAD7827213.1 hypothetical protein ACOMICROBIO_LMKGKHOH_04023 [Vibrio sp. B1FIG11]CAE6963142.1 hypothetical protein ACOMICROBIO_LMKGKHOH_04023 [Vibrio sp. B1FIG11]
MTTLPYSSQQSDVIQRHIAAPSFGLQDLAGDVYVLGCISADWPDKSVENEFRSNIKWIAEHGIDISQPDFCRKVEPCSAALPLANHQPRNKDKDLECIRQVLKTRRCRYLARELDWYLEDIHGNRLYRLIPSEYNMQQLINALVDYDSTNPSAINALVVGRASGQLGELDSVTVTKFRSMAAHDIAKNLPKLHNSQSCRDLTHVIELYLSLANNNGATDEERALNYLLTYGYDFYERMYRQRSDSSHQSIHLVSVDARSHYAGERTLVYVVFNFQDSKTSAVESWYSTVDVTDRFPFLVSKFEPYINVL